MRPSTLPPSARSGPRRRALLAAASALVVAAATGVTLTAHADVPDTPDGFKLVFSDDFTGDKGTLPSDEWIKDLGHRYENPPGPDNWGTGEIESNTADPANVSLDGTGNLLITPLSDGAGGFTSARIETRQLDFKAPEGGVLRVEGRLKLPNVSGRQAIGYWPAFWMLGAPHRGDRFSWPGIGEFDLMENVNGLNKVFATLHCGVAPGGPCNEFTGRSNGGVDCNCQADFHTYRLEWDRSVTPNQFRWFLDGNQVHAISQADLPADTFAQMTGHAGYYIILNVAVGGAFPDALAGERTPSAEFEPGHPMAIDYVAVWTKSA